MEHDQAEPRPRAGKRGVRRGLGGVRRVPGPTAAQLGSGRVLAVAVAAGIADGVRLQPVLASALDRARRSPAPTVIQAADVL